MALLTLREKSRYLKELEINSNGELRSDEITTCEDFADVFIEGVLGKTFDQTSQVNIPKIIEHIADLVGSAKAWNFLNTGQSPKKNEYAEGLLKEAKDLLKMITKKELGIKHKDGTWDEDYPGLQNVEGKEPEDIEIII